MLVPWTRQPPGTTFVGLDPQNPLAQGIVSGIDARGWSLVGKGVSQVTARSFAPQPGGVAFIGNNARLLSEQMASGQIDYPFTVVLYLSNITRTANANVLGGLGNTGGNQLATFIASTVGTVTANKFTFRNVNAGTAYERAYSANATATSTGPVVLSVTVNSGSSVDLYWNGVLDNGSGTSSTSGTPAFDRFAIGGVDRGTDVFADTGNNVLLGFVTSKGWRAQDHFNYAKNPWQVFRPTEVPVKAPAAGGTTVAPSKGALTFTGYVPTVTRTDNQTVAPAKGALAFTGKVPTVTRTDNQTVAPAKGALTFTGYVPTVTQDSGTVIAPSKGALTFTGKVPTITQTANQIIVPSKGALTFTGKIPTVTQTGAVTYARAPRGSGYPGTPPTTTRPGQTNTARPAMANTRR